MNVNNLPLPVIYPTLGESALILFVSDAPTRANPDPDPPPVADRWHIGRLHFSGEGI